MSDPADTEDRRKAFARVLALCTDLPEIATGTSYGNPAIKVRDKAICVVKTEDTLVLMCSLEHKDFLLALDPDLYYQTDHFKGWPALLVHLDRIGDDELAYRLAESWRRRAPKRVLAAYEKANGGG